VGSGGASHAALQAQVSLALDLARRGQREDALKILRAVLYEDLDCAPAQEAVQEVRRASLAARPAAAATPPMLSARPAAPTSPTQGPSSTSPLVPPGRSFAPASLPRAVATGDRVPERASPRRGSSMSWRLGAALVAVGGLAAALTLLDRRSASPPAPTLPTPPLSAAVAPPSPSEPAGGQDDSGPLAGIDRALREAIRDTLTLYGRALEKADPALLAQARPDLGADARERAVAPFRGALNVATDLRVLEVVRHGDRATVSVLRTDLIIGGRQAEAPPVEETLRFERRGAAWGIQPGRR